jgi:hypothetical protein
MTSKTVKDYYAILGLTPKATLEEIRLAYRKLARVYHPDLSSEIDAEERFREVNQAYDVLANAEKRKAYDFFINSAGSESEFDTEDVKSSKPTDTPPVNVQPRSGPAASAPASIPQKQLTPIGKKRLYPPTWAVLLMLIGGCIIVSVGIGAILSLQQNKPTGGAESVNVSKLMTFMSPPIIPQDVTVLQEGGTSLLTVRPKSLSISGTTFPVVAVVPEQGRLPLPEAQQSVALWVHGTLINYVIGLPANDVNETLLAGLSSSARISLVLDNGTVLVFGSAQSQRVAADDLSPMSQDRPGLTVMLLGANTTDRLVVHARHLPEDSLPADGQKADDVRIKVLDTVVLGEAGGKTIFIVEYEVVNEGAGTIDPAVFDLVLEDASGKRYMLDAETSARGQYGAPKEIIQSGKSTRRSAGYIIPKDIATPLTWLFRADTQSSNVTRVILPYKTPPPQPAIPDVVLTDVFLDVQNNVIVISGTVFNDGESNLEVTANDVNLNAGTGEGALQAASPPFSWIIGPDASQDFEIQFTVPQDTDTVLLDILRFAFEIEGLSP